MTRSGLVIFSLPVNSSAQFYKGKKMNFKLNLVAAGLIVSTLSALGQADQAVALKCKPTAKANQGYSVVIGYTQLADGSVLNPSVFSRFLGPNGRVHRLPLVPGRIEGSVEHYGVSNWDISLDKSRQFATVEVVGQLFYECAVAQSPAEQLN